METILTYFRNKGFSRLIANMFDIYSRYGRAYGAVNLANPTPEEEKAISAFFGRDYYNQALIRIGLAEFERQMQKQFNSPIKLNKLLEDYCGKPLYPPPQKEKLRTDEFTTIVATLQQEYRNTIVEGWLQDCITYTRRIYKKWTEKSHTKSSEVMESFKIICRALTNLPSGKKRLTDFSKEITGSSRTLEFYGEEGDLFIRALAFICGKTVPAVPEEAIGIYYQCGLLYHGLLSQVMATGIKHQPTLITLEGLSNTTKVEANSQRVFVIQDPLVYSSVVERLKHDSKYTIICPISTDDTAFLELLKLCAASKYTIYFAGNIDYSGLAYADMLYTKFEKNFKAWRYSKADYELIINAKNYLLPDKKKELAFHNDDLASMLSHLLKTGKSGASMPLVPLLVQDIINSVQ